MKISLDWLKDFVDLSEPDPREIARRLTASVGEVENVQIQGELLEHCCVGKVTSIEKHPNADKLSLCTVKTDQGLKNVVCGGTNLREGMRVAFAHVGARVRWHGQEMMNLAAVKIRGEDSEGMICAASELDLTGRFPAASDHDIIDLGDGDSDVGRPLKEFFGLTDVVFHIDNHAITHRADLFSHAGIARELVALGLAGWKKKKKMKALPFTKNPIPFRFHNDIKDLVPRYASCVIAIDGPGETPEWMQRRLEATGWRSVSLPVDITNYVAMETGMPLHAFDTDDITGDVHIRLSKEGETLETLDGVTRTLPDGAIVLSDDAGIFDLMGIMGGLRSSTKATTRRIYLHSTCVDPVSIRRAIIATGHRTDAATVYEKGIPRVTVERGFQRAVALFLAHVPGAHIVTEEETWGNDGDERVLDLSLERIEKTLGISIPLKRVMDIFSALEFGVKASKGKHPLLTVTVPLHRLGDIRADYDLVEEVGRIAGYDAIEPALPDASIAPPPRDMRTQNLRQAWKEEGYIEILPLSLVGATLLAKAGFDPSQALVLQNPIGDETALLHTSMLPSLLEHAERSLRLTDGTLRTFHWGNVFARDETEHLEWGALLTEKETPDLSRHPFLLLKRDLIQSLKKIGYDAACITGDAPAYAHPGQCADITVSGRRVGQIFTMHPTVTERFKIGSAAAVLINLTELLSFKPSVTIPIPVPLFPSVSYDETMECHHSQTVGGMMKRAKTGDALLESIETMDVYRGPKDPVNSYKLTLRFTYRAADRTLTEEEAVKAHAAVLSAMRIPVSK